MKILYQRSTILYHRWYQPSYLFGDSSITVLVLCDNVDDYGDDKDLFGDSSIPVLVHGLEQFLQGRFLPHELSEGEPAVKVFSFNKNSSNALIQADQSGSITMYLPSKSRSISSKNSSTSFLIIIANISGKEKFPKKVELSGIVWHCLELSDHHW